jgi:hypothetical protein
MWYRNPTIKVLAKAVASTVAVLIGLFILGKLMQ